MDSAVMNYEMRFANHMSEFFTIRCLSAEQSVEWPDSEEAIYEMYIIRWGYEGVDYRERYDENDIYIQYWDKSIALRYAVLFNKEPVCFITLICDSIK